MQSLRGKVAIITGASSGIGAGIAQYFARQGARLSLNGRKEDNLNTEASKTNLPASEILTTVGDITKDEDRRQLIDRTVEKFGGIDILINNAGVAILGPMENFTEQDYDTVMNINLKAAVFLTKLAIPHLVKSKGNIVNISSTASSTMRKEQGTYTMSKVALDAYTKVLAAELGPRGVRVNAVNPGFVRTNIVAHMDLPEEVFDQWGAASPMGRAGTTEEVAKVTAFLASDLASFVTGELLYVDGGLRLAR